MALIFYQLKIQKKKKTENDKLSLKCNQGSRYQVVNVFVFFRTKVSRAQINLLKR